MTEMLNTSTTEVKRDPRIVVWACIRCGRCCHNCPKCFCHDICPRCKQDGPPEDLSRAAVMNRLCKGCLAVIALREKEKHVNQN